MYKTAFPRLQKSGGGGSMFQNLVRKEGVNFFGRNGGDRSALERGSLL